MLGPGSLYTSLLPSLLIPEIRDAVAAATSARAVYVCNVATQDGETTGFDLADHVEALDRHTAPGIVDVVLANDRFDARVPPTGRPSPSACAGRRRHGRRHRGSSSMTSSTPTTPITTTRPAWRRGDPARARRRGRPADDADRGPDAPESPA